MTEKYGDRIGVKERRERSDPSTLKGEYERKPDLSKFQAVKDGDSQYYEDSSNHKY